MSKHSVVADGKVMDIVWRRARNEPGHQDYVVELGGKAIGRVMGGPRSGWCGINYTDPSKNYMVPLDGWKSRWAATEFIILCAGYWNRRGI